MYLEKKVKNGYNSYINAEENDFGTMMDVGLLIMDKGEVHREKNMDKEMAIVLLEGRADVTYGKKRFSISRRDMFHEEAWCMLFPSGYEVSVSAGSHCECYIQKTVNKRMYDPLILSPYDIQVQAAGRNQELDGCVRRDIKTFFDYDNAPYSNMVLGEVLNYPGKWSSYPPHRHPQPEVYFYRFDRPQGFGAAFGNGSIEVSHHNGLLAIDRGFHSQVSAPGYTMCYLWGIRHLEGEPWIKTRIDEEEHKWLNSYF